MRLTGLISGRPSGTRVKLNKAFLEDMLASWRQHGANSIERIRMRDPGLYCRLVAATLPKEFTFESTTADLDVEQIDILIEHLKERLLTKRADEALPILIEEPKAIANANGKLGSGHN